MAPSAPSIDGVEDIDALVGGLSAAERERAEFGSYSREQYYDDLARVTQYRSHPDMADMLIENSRDTLFWLQQQGLRFVPLYEWQFKLPDGRVRFSGGSALEVNGAGEGASEALFRTAERRGARVFYGTKALSLIDEGGRIGGVIARRGEEDIAIRARRRDPRLRRLRGECRMAHALSRPLVGPRQGARLALQHRRRPADGARLRRGAVRQLVRMPFGELGSQRARRERARIRRRVQARRLSRRHRRQRRRRTLLRRRRRHPRADLCQARPRHSRPAGPGRLADFRQARRRAAARRISRQAIGALQGRYAGSADRASSTASSATPALPPSRRSTRRCAPTSPTIPARRTAAARKASLFRSRTGRSPSPSRRSKPMR